MKSKITCMGQTTVKIEIDKKIIYMDPVVSSKKADIILYSGADEGYAEDVLKKIYKKSTRIFCPTKIFEKIKTFIDEKNVHIVSAKEKVDIGIGEIDIVSAYAVDSFMQKDKPFQDHVGFIISVDEETLYFSGPTNIIPEMNIIEANVAFLPVAGNYMDLFEALAATNVIHAEKFVPIAYADDEKEGLILCQRFTKKCVYPTELFRNKKDLPVFEEIVS